MNSLKLIIIFLMTNFLLGNIAAQDAVTKLSMGKNIVEMARQFKNSPVNYQLEQQVETKTKSCLNCPNHLVLTEQINKVVEKLAQNLEYDQNSKELPTLINHLKFLYYTQVFHDQNGQIKCLKYLDPSTSVQESKFDDQFKFVAEDVLKFDAVSGIQYINPNMDEVVYYYRGEGADSDIVIQAIFKKDGAKFRYYRNMSGINPENPYNLPDMAAVKVKKREPKPSDNMEFKDTGIDPVSDKADLIFKAQVEKNKNFPFPKNIHFVEARLVKAISEDNILNIDASNDVSLKGSEAKLGLKNGKKDLVILANTIGINGRVESSVTIPYSIRTLDALPAMEGAIRKSNTGTSLNMSMKGQDQVLTLEMANNGNGNSTAIRHTQVLVDNAKAKIMMILEVSNGRDDNGHQKTFRVIYQIGGIFK